MLLIKEHPILPEIDLPYLILNPPKYIPQILANGSP